MPPGRGTGPIRFGQFELDLTTGELRKRGVRLNLPDQAFQVLRALLECPGDIVSRAELQDRLWPERTFVDFDSAINKCVSQLRSLLDDSGAASRFIETLPRRGYRFVAPVRAEPPTAQTAGVVVLPFENLTGDAGRDFVAEGVTDLITTSLGQGGDLRVIARTSARACAAAARGMADIGRQQSPGVAQLASTLTQMFNAELVRILAQLSMLPGTTISQLDAFALLHAIVADPQTYGLSNVTNACVRPDVPPFFCRQPDEYLFWDGIHPTRAGHAITAAAGAAALGQ